MDKFYCFDIFNACNVIGYTFFNSWSVYWFDKNREIKYTKYSRLGQKCRSSDLVEFYRFHSAGSFFFK